MTATDTRPSVPVTCPSWCSEPSDHLETDRLDTAVLHGHDVLVLDLPRLEQVGQAMIEAARLIAADLDRNAQ